MHAKKLSSLVYQVEPSSSCVASTTRSVAPSVDISMKAGEAERRMVVGVTANCIEWGGGRLKTSLTCVEYEMVVVLLS